MMVSGPVCQAKNVIWRRIGDDVVVITADGQSTHILNKTTGYIWELIDGNSSIADITAKLFERFEVSLEEAGRDVTEIIEKMIQLGIIYQAGETEVVE